MNKFTVKKPQVLGTILLLLVVNFLWSLSSGISYAIESFIKFTLFWIVFLGIITVIEYLTIQKKKK